MFDSLRYASDIGTKSFVFQVKRKIKPHREISYLQINRFIFYNSMREAGYICFQVKCYIRVNMA